jgi:hypothetical protein
MQPVHEDCGKYLTLSFGSQCKSLFWSASRVVLSGSATSSLTDHIEDGMGRRSQQGLKAILDRYIVESNNAQILWHLVANR